MRLTFQNNQFILHGFMSEFEERVLDLKGAAGFRPYADHVAEKVLSRALVKYYQAPSLPPLPFLDPHQLEGVNWILTRSRSYLAHAPGAGKTAQAVIAACLAESEGGHDQALFIVPPSLTANWAREVVKWTEFTGDWPSIGLVTVSALQQEVDWNAEFIICPDSMLTRPWVREKLKRPWKLIAVDEASRFKEDTSERSKALFGGKSKKYKYPGLIQLARHAVLLDGSPMPNRPMELWAPTYAMAPEAIDFRDKQDFGFRYCGAKVNDFGRWEFKHESNGDELHKKLTEKFMHVVGEEKLNHPERRRSLLFMNQDPRTPEMRTWERKHLSALNFNDVSEDMVEGDLARYRRLLGESKVHWIANYISERLTNKKESILLFAWHRSVTEALADLLSKYNPGLIIGGASAAYRENIFRDFQDGKRELIIGNIAAMGRGHNLQRAKRVVFGEFSWTDQLNLQCEKRASRKGATDSFVRCEYIVAPGTLDEPVLNSVFRKIANVKKVIG